MTDQDEQDHSFYEYLRDSHTQATRAFDRAVLTLSGGALALSITFVDNISGSGSPVGRSWLVTGWVALTLSLLTITGSFLSSERIFWHAMENNEEHSKRWNDRTRYLNWTAGGSLVVGFFGLALFGYLNL